MEQFFVAHSETILSALGTVFALVYAMHRMTVRLEVRFSRIESRLDALESRFYAVEKRIEHMQREVISLIKGLAVVRGRLGAYRKIKPPVEKM